MPHQAAERNPFMLMLNPEVVLAAIENSERLAKLNSHMCRPLDRASGAAAMVDDDSPCSSADGDPVAASEMTLAP